MDLENVERKLVVWIVVWRILGNMRSAENSYPLKVLYVVRKVYFIRFEVTV